VWWPDVAQLATTADVAELIRGCARSFVLHEGADTPLIAELDAESMPRAGEMVLVVGPEGGISPSEIDVLTQAGATPVRLGQTVLRTSTAGVVGATLVLAGTDSWTSVSEGKEGTTRD